MIKAFIIFMIGCLFGMIIMACIAASHEDELEDEWLQDMLDHMDD